MRAVRVHETAGPSSVVVDEVPEPEPREGWVLVDVHAVGVSFPDLLLSQGLYQVRPEPPFTLGVDAAGVVVDGPNPFTTGQRVALVLPHGAAAERVLVPADSCLPVPEGLSLTEAAALPLNYLTAHFTLVERAQLCPGEWVLVHGAAGGVGTATLQVARGIGARTIAVTSTREKADYALAAGADEAVLLDGFKDAVMQITRDEGVDVVVDVVGGEVFTDSLRVLAPQGRLMVVGFASGQGIPEVRVNRLLLNNIDVRGVGWGAYALTRAGYLQQQWQALLPLMEQGVLRPPIGTTYPLEQFSQALEDLAERRTLGKGVVLLDRPEPA